MALESLLLVHLEFVLGTDDEDLVVHRLSDDPRVGRVWREDRHGMKIGLTDFLDFDGYSIFPHLRKEKGKNYENKKTLLLIAYSKGLVI